MIKVIQGLIFDIVSDKAILMGLNNTYNLNHEAELTVPKIVDGKLVREIASNAFSRCDIKKWSLPTTIDLIGESAFKESSVEQVIFYGPLTYPYKEELIVSANAFKNCQNLKFFSTSQKIMAAEYAFWGCDNLTKDPMRHAMRFLIIRQTSISNCPNLTEIHICENGVVCDKALESVVIHRLRIDENVLISEYLLDYIRNNNVSIIAKAGSGLDFLAYLGVPIIIE